ncbi:hypothetical protein K443DRAFT_444600 [Laccaria amethystina LaAM-08-1]|uniref:Unplaced genomic scaffold K443scaffold_392, whole genome shotgun sequence n=1 Tax=Laccaria amethystina LaAM-08-1 TaxID=1095629 RepID=A0A0C9WI25_9AGAR|nr:hypothetical protein K443DRAFT_444600 [Laccaria amethystina LaAM-08-1]
MFVGEDNIDGSKECSQAKRGLWSLKFINVRSRGPASLCSILYLLDEKRRYRPSQSPSTFYRSPSTS